MNISSFVLLGDVINVVLEVILVEIVVMINEITTKMAMNIGKFLVKRYSWLME
jgi:hypothetical protein